MYMEGALLAFIVTLAGVAAQSVNFTADQWDDSYIELIDSKYPYANNQHGDWLAYRASRSFGTNNYPYRAAVSHNFAPGVLKEASEIICRSFVICYEYEAVEVYVCCFNWESATAAA